MNIRDLVLADKIEVDKMYHNYWNHNEYPNFLDKKLFPASFVVTEDNKIVLAGGVKIIAEAIVITDRAFSTRDRQIALLQALGCSVNIVNGLGFSEIHAFVNGDDYYVKHLQKYGFKLMSEKLLILRLANG